MEQFYRIVIAEDDSIILMSLKMALENMGHTVVGEALDGLEALEKIRQSKPDLLLMDINMPKMDGLEVLAQIKNEMLIPSIVITAYPDDELVKRAMNVGAYAYLLKPVIEAQLKTAIEITMCRFSEFVSASQAAKKAEQTLNERKLVERAKGILMDKFGLKEADALRALQKKSRDSNKRIAAVAQEIIASANKL